MKFVVQRVLNASCTVNNAVIGKIDKGFCVFIGISDSDNEAIADKMLDKLTKLRIFEDENGKTNLSIADVKGQFLLISQFTLYADCRKGNRPSFSKAGNPELANNLYQYIIGKVQSLGFETQTGEFGADMKIQLLNDGPFTIILDSDEIVKQ